MVKKTIVKCLAVLFLLNWIAGIAESASRKPMMMNFQKIVLYHSKKTGEYYLAAVATDDKVRLGNLDTMNVHVILEYNEGNKKEINNEDLKIACLGNMYNKVIGQKTTLFRFNLIIDNSGSIDPQSLNYVQKSLTKFIDLVPLVFDAQVIRFSSGVQLKTPFSKDKEVLKEAVNRALPQGGTTLYDAIDEGVMELKSLGDDVPLRFAVILTDGMDTASQRNRNVALFKQKIINECRQNYIPLFIVGVTDKVNSQLMKEIAGFGFYQHIKNFPDIDKAFDVILNLIKDTYVFKIPAVGNFANLKTIYLVKKTRGGNNETIQDFIVH